MQQMIDGQWQTIQEWDTKGNAVGQRETKLSDHAVSLHLAAAGAEVFVPGGIPCTGDIRWRKTTGKGAQSAAAM